MHHNTKHIKDSYQYAGIQMELVDKVRLLKDKYAGERCFIVGAGPSLKNYDVDDLKDKLKDELIITLKQSYELLEEIVDYQILNFSNWRTYNYKNNNPIIVWELFERNHIDIILQKNIKYDILLPTEGNWNEDEMEKFKNSQCGSLSFDDWTLDKTVFRQFGPSLIFEMAIPLALYMGVKEIITLGWDIGDIDKFRETGEEEIFQEHFDNSLKKIEYAKTSQTRLELETIINSTEFLNKWLKGKDVDLKIISDRNPAHESIERMEFDAL